MIENQSLEDIKPSAIINNKLTLLEHLTATPVKQPVDELVAEYKTYSKDVRILTYQMLLEKFNEKYDHLNPKQKEVLRQVINSVDNTDKLKDFYNSQILEIQNILSKKITSVTNEVVKIKLQEVSKYIKPLQKTEKLTNDYVINLLQYYELLNEL